MSYSGFHVQAVSMPADSEERASESGRRSAASTAASFTRVVHPPRRVARIAGLLRSDVPARK